MSETERPDPYAGSQQPTLRDLVGQQRSAPVVGLLFGILAVVVVSVVVVATMVALLG